MRISQLLVIFITSLLALHTNNALANNTIISTVPTIQNWTAGSGEFTAVDGSNIIIHSSSAGKSTELAGITTAVADTANHLVAEMLAVTNLNYTVITSDQATKGDILLKLLPSLNTALGDEGYILEIGGNIKIKANTNTGLYYGAQSVLQVLKADDDHKNVNKGRVVDYPSLPERGIMIDAGRKYWKIDYLKDLVRTLGWQKMNRLHIHFTEWNAFRLASDNPALLGLAAVGSYSQTEIDDLEAFAKEHHVIIVPEVDIPGHAKLLGDYSKEDAFSCESMGSAADWEGSSGPRWTVDYTGVSENSPNTGRDFLSSLINEFVPWFDGPYFHIGTDEVPEGSHLSDCPDITNYVADNTNVSVNGDVLVEFIDETNNQIKALGKKTQMWNWYERTPTSNSAAPSNDILVDVWAGNAENNYIAKGFDVIKTGAGGFYLTPGFKNTFPSNNTIYTWNNTSSAHLKGVKVSVWTDTAYTWPDQQFENLMFDSRAVSAERNWYGVQDTTTLSSFLTRARNLGTPATLSGEKNSINKKLWSIHAVSSEETNNEDGAASNAFDGLGTTIWHSNYSNGNNDNFPYNLDIDLGATYDLYGARFQTRRNNQRDLNGLVDSYDFSVSSDGINWTAVVTDGEFYDLINERKARTINFSKQTARYVRFTPKSATNNDRFASLAELDLFGTTVGGAPIVREYAKIQIRSKTDMSFCLGLEDESESLINGDKSEMRSCLNTDNYQLWQRRDEGNGYISLRLASDDNKCLDVHRGADGTVNSNDQLIIWDCHLGNNQLWKVEAKDYGYFNIQSKANTDVCIDIDSTSSQSIANKDLIQLQPCASRDQQQWVLIE